MLSDVPEGFFYSLVLCFPALNAALIIKCFYEDRICITPKRLLAALGMVPVEDAVAVIGA